jgi:hypothetical protein
VGAIILDYAGRMRAGDVSMLNNPYRGGTRRRHRGVFFGGRSGWTWRKRCLTFVCIARGRFCGPILFVVAVN